MGLDKPGPPFGRRVEQENTLIAWVQASGWRMAALADVRSLGLRSWAIGAGAVRDLVWNQLGGLPDVPPAGDVDVVHFDPDRDDDDAPQAQLVARSPASVGGGQPGRRAPLAAGPGAAHLAGRWHRLVARGRHLRGGDAPRRRPRRRDRALRPRRPVRAGGAPKPALPVARGVRGAQVEEALGRGVEGVRFEEG